MKNKTTHKKGEAMNIKFYYNGIKIDNGKLIRCYYNLDVGAVKLYFKDYIAYNALPEDFNLKNDSDAMIDYSEDSSACIFDSNRYYTTARIAGLKVSLKHAKKSIIAEKVRALNNPNHQTFLNIVRKREYHINELNAELNQLQKSKKEKQPHD